MYTNNVPRGAFRGFGGPQAVYCAEQMVNKLAAALGHGPGRAAHAQPGQRRLAADHRRALPARRHHPRGDRSLRPRRRLGADPPTVGRLTQSAPRIDPEQPYLRRGVGLACAHKNVGFSYGYPENCTVGIELYGEAEIERAVIRHGASEVGMGAHTVITQMAAEALGIAMEKIELISTDTAQVKDAGSVSASRMTFFIGNAIKEGAEKALAKWANEERPVQLDHTYWPHKTTAPDPETGQCDPNVAYAYTAQAAEVVGGYGDRAGEDRKDHLRHRRGQSHQPPAGDRADPGRAGAVGGLRGDGEFRRKGWPGCSPPACPPT